MSRAASDREGRGLEEPARAPWFHTATQRADRRWHRALSLGTMGAVLLHAVLLLLFRTTTLPPMPFSAAGPRAGDIRAAAGGGSGLTMVEIQVEQAPAEEAEPEPVPVPEAVVVPRPEVRPEPSPEPAPRAPVTQPGTGGPGEGGESGRTTGPGPGTTTGTGAGGGGTEEQGRSGLVPPTPRGMILPPSDRPRSVRGMEVTVWVFVTERGRVAPDSTRLEPPTPDSRYNERLKRSASEWVFEPARRDGRPVGAWYPFEIIL